VDKIIRIGIDTSKSVFVLHGVNAADEPVLRKKLRRRQVLDFFRIMEPTRIGLEACGAAHYWARELMALGHAVVLLPPQYVKPYVQRGKNDAADASAICEAMSRPRMRFVPGKTAEQQAARSSAIQAALHPTKGDWTYFLTVNPVSGLTKFTTSYSVFLGYVQELDAYNNKHH